MGMTTTVSHTHTVTRTRPLSGRSRLRVVSRGTGTASRKIQALRTAESFTTDRSAPWKLASLHPPIIIGPVLAQHTADALPESVAMIYRYMSGEKKVADKKSIGFIDVRDLAAAHIAAAENEEAEGRYLLSGGCARWLTVAKALKEHFPDSPVPTEEGEGAEIVDMQIDSERAIRDLHFTPRPLVESLRDTGDYFKSCGLL
eukprot:Sspe_Gene.97071::Locus_70734_Transcript_1_1_Confidence_1.000_Length_1094::g.97071::m.97071